MACALVFYVGSLRASGRVGVLALARDVSAGQVLTASDLRVVGVSADASLSTVAASAAATVIGGTVAVPRPAGTLLSTKDVGAAAFPPAGKAVVAVALKPGQFPPALGAGARVMVLITAGTDGAGSSAVSGSGKATADRTSDSTGGSAGQGMRSSSLGGVVLSVSPPTSTSSDGSSVIALLMDQNSATVLGAAQGSGTGNQAASVSLLWMPANASGTG